MKNCNSGSDLTLCKCNCHNFNEGVIRHMVACCDKCDTCDQNIRTGMMDIHKKNCPYLKNNPMIKGNDFLVPMGIYLLPACNHTKTVHEHKKDCTSYFSSEWYKKKWKLDGQINKIGPPILLDMRRQQKGKDGNYATIFSSFERRLNEIAIPQNRIVDAIFSTSEECKKFLLDANLSKFDLHFLVKNHYPELDPGYKKEPVEDFLVFHFKIYLSSGIFFSVGRFLYDYVWCGERENRFVALI
ncbi:hypothetical protein A3C57_02055 [Candidatus Nomurabacteria bacterium RIFCSPHIGHO2_02_FULL_33_12]|uniref:Uncharacterized protein n=1 Tax=Candidatus Nomurabacteria bacterium RIFCSPLOWO2_01_FULL_33_17 TaxID=1801764 RepID=A0A1F6WP59_9BACT|nr:MAG: hypothetical protein A3C57_02055 [Candidatus Nomurabacteria bacterium RIFCSPHIGHO2_02_FULL_33_12]OGI83681.1 MAG: hypothetical protein A2903_01325 [Candidatus Nomurabacteria bacterium RIFCSPLOWO2_01_FULL_33_17]